MKTSISFLTTSLSVFLMLAGCQSALPSAIDPAATINAAVNATATAQANLSSSIDAAVKATQAAQASAFTPTAASKSATPKSGATATPSGSYVTMTEEELAALIDQAVKEAVAATTTTTTSTTSSTSDGTLTTQEVQALQTASATAQTEINQALALGQAYYDLYAEIAPETLATLQAIEQDLNSMSSSMSSIATSLSQISATMAQGQATAQSAITQLNAAAQKASQAAASVQTKEKNWIPTVQTQINKSGADALNVKPTNVPTDLKGTAGSVNTYMDTVRVALTDGKINQAELKNISLAGANATAGLQRFGGAQSQGLTDGINTLTQQLARGEAPKSKNNVTNLEQSARSFSAQPSINGGPQPPSLPQPPLPQPTRR